MFRRLALFDAEDGGGTREQFAQFVASEQQKWARVVEAVNVKVDT